ncbi:MAG TPA: hypothetical protein P5333_23725, partial [Caldilinea sp.]|nr:hypothetical protein [Caldilinea sp.]
MALWHIARVACEHRQAGRLSVAAGIVGSEAAQQFRRGEVAEARGGKLNGQRQAVEPATDLDDGRNSRRIQGKVVVHGLGALGEELHRTGCGHCFLREPAIDIRHAQARHAVHVLA